MTVALVIVGLILHALMAVGGAIEDVPMEEVPTRGD